MNPFQLLVCAALAVWELLEIWHHSQLLAGWRAWLTAGEGRLSQLARCMFCLAPWTSLVLVSLWTWTPTRGSAELLLLSLAVARLANLGNDLTHAFCRTPQGYLPREDGETDIV